MARLITQSIGNEHQEKKGLRGLPPSAMSKNTTGFCGSVCAAIVKINVRSVEMFVEVVECVDVPFVEAL